MNFIGGGGYGPINAPHYFQEIGQRGINHDGVVGILIIIISLEL